MGRRGYNDVVIGLGTWLRVEGVCFLLDHPGANSNFLLVASAMKAASSAYTHTYPGRNRTSPVCF